MLPEQYQAEKQEIQHQIKKIKTQNAELPPEKKIKFNVRNGFLYVNNKLQRKTVHPPTIAELFAVKPRELKVRLHSQKYEGHTSGLNFCILVPTINYRLPV